MCCEQNWGAATVYTVYIYFLFQMENLTDPSDALAPTLSPVAFQQTSKMPPVPR